MAYRRIIDRVRGIGYMVVALQVVGGLVARHCEWVLVTHLLQEFHMIKVREADAGPWTTLTFWTRTSWFERC